MQQEPVYNVVFMKKFETKEDTCSIKTAPFLAEDVIVDVSHQITTHAESADKK